MVYTGRILSGSSDHVAGVLVEAQSSLVLRLLDLVAVILEPDLDLQRAEPERTC